MNNFFIEKMKKYRTIMLVFAVFLLHYLVEQYTRKIEVFSGIETNIVSCRETVERFVLEERTYFIFKFSIPENIEFKVAKYGSEKSKFRELCNPGIPVTIGYVSVYSLLTGTNNRLGFIGASKI